jgi:hypothetical protein
MCRYSLLLQSEKEKLWIAQKVEESTDFLLSAEEKKHCASLLMKAKVDNHYCAVIHVVLLP